MRAAERARQVWYIVPHKAAAAFEAAVARTLGGDRRRALASLGAKHVMPALSPQELRELGVLRVVQPPGYAIVTLPVRAVCAANPGVALSVRAVLSAWFGACRCDYALWHVGAGCLA